jgi:hypothetical protein
MLLPFALGLEDLEDQPNDHEDDDREIPNQSD